MRSFLRDEMAIITVIATGHMFQNIECDGLSVEQAIYKFGRTSVMHEGELDPRLTFSADGSFSFGASQMSIPPAFIFGMTVATIISTENKGESMTKPFPATILGDHYSLNDHWGNPAIKSGIHKKFKR